MAALLAFGKGRLFDAVGGDPIPNAVVLVDGSRIIAAGPSRSIRIPRRARRVDADGLTLLPGLIDCHVHFGYQLRSIDEESREWVSQRLFRMIPSIRATLEAGVTTVRDAGMTPVGVKLAIDEGILAGPRLQCSIAAISQTGGHGDWTTPSGLDPYVPLPDVPRAVADGQDGVRRVVRRLIRAGAEWIKICATGGVLSPLDPPDTPQLTIDEIGVAVAEARAAGLRGVMAHAIGAEGVKNALRSGVRSIEHGYLIDDEGLELLSSSRAFLVPTVQALVSVRERADSEPGTLAPSTMAKLAVAEAGQRRTLGEAIARGVQIAMGTDSGVGLHGINGREIGLLVRAGMTPIAALQAATSVAAELLDLKEDLGTIEPGKLADLIAVAGDPLDDPDIVGDPTNIRLVLKEGLVAKDTDGRTSNGESRHEP